MKLSCFNTAVAENTMYKCTRYSCTAGYQTEGKILIYSHCTITGFSNGSCPLSNFHHCHLFHLCDNTCFIIHEGPFLQLCHRSRWLIKRSNLTRGSHRIPPWLYYRQVIPSVYHIKCLHFKIWNGCSTQPGFMRI